MCGLEVSSTQVSDAARKAVFPAVPWQRCYFHLCQNAQAWPTSILTRVGGVFPNPESCERLVGSLLMEQHDEWMEEKGIYFSYGFPYEYLTDFHTDFLGHFENPWRNSFRKTSPGQWAFAVITVRNTLHPKLMSGKLNLVSIYFCIHLKIRESEKETKKAKMDVA